MNEFELIKMLTQDAPRSINDLIQGVDDDCAVINAKDKRWLITADTLLEGVHFKLSYTDLRSLGKRILNVNLSDIAAMGGEPRFYIACIAIPHGFDSHRCFELYRGMSDAAESHRAILIGGDTVYSPAHLTMTITVIGEMVDAEPIFRSGAKPGDVIYVTGTLGDGTLGLKCLEKGLFSEETLYFIERYRVPEARIPTGRWLAGTGMVTSMIDISDGLMADLGHLADLSKTGYELDMSNIPFHQGLKSVCSKLGEYAEQIILAGGDDYELVFTVSGHRAKEFEDLLRSSHKPFNHPITKIGTMVADTKKRTPTPYKGYDHLEAIE